ncbi:MAG: accessory gene regulator B family protein [Bacilli bacterium]|nr:accessory gene regulator B family protein [Bacilli bacterium]
MRNFVINNLMIFVKNNNTYNDVKLAEIKYGLEAIYLLFSKSIIIFSLAIILGIFKEFLIFAVFYNIIRMPSFGLHATKSWICLVSSSLIFILAPYLCIYINIDIFLKSFLGIVNIILIYKNAPADTHKKPIINSKRRLCYKYISVLLAITFSFTAVITNNSLISNTLLLSLVVQNFMISPYIYRLFHLPYNNYLTYVGNNNLGLN